MRTARGGGCLRWGRVGHQDRSFGVFVRLASDVKGFLQLSEPTDEPIENPHQLVDEGELTTVKVGKVDLQRRRLRPGAVGGAERTSESATTCSPNDQLGHRTRVGEVEAVGEVHDDALAGPFSRASARPG
ncbi:S1 RNA-binding domain-containing protein [Kitasatospora sp. NPDC089509]|uniref:S1 RNA-binding domain-containing protein n=1 Tax=Kitasatospora sp. NPDC089509 TaxID=3364079 RepID=UPI003826BC1E